MAACLCLLCFQSSILLLRPRLLSVELLILVVLLLDDLRRSTAGAMERTTEYMATTVSVVVTTCLASGSGVPTQSGDGGGEQGGGNQGDDFCAWAETYTNVNRAASLTTALLLIWWSRTIFKGRSLREKVTAFLFTLLGGSLDILASLATTFCANESALSAWNIFSTIGVDLLKLLAAYLAAQGARRTRLEEARGPLPPSPPAQGSPDQRDGGDIALEELRH